MSHLLYGTASYCLVEHLIHSGPTVPSELPPAHSHALQACVDRGLVAHLSIVEVTDAGRTAYNTNTTRRVAAVLQGSSARFSDIRRRTGLPQQHVMCALRTLKRRGEVQSTNGRWAWLGRQAPSPAATPPAAKDRTKPSSPPTPGLVSPPHATPISAVLAAGEALALDRAAAEHHAVLRSSFAHIRTLCGLLSA